MAAQAVVAPPPPPRPAITAPPASGGSLQQNASLYVGDLDPLVTEMDLVEAFRQMGPLASIRLCRDRFSHKSLRYAYINFFSPSHAAKAIACLNHTVLKGKPMRIMWCHRDPLTRKTGVANIFIKNLDRSMTSARLERIFCKFGTILSCKVAEEHGKSKGFGFVQFDSEDSSMAAVNALHGTMLEGKKLYVSKFVKKSERKDACEEPIFTNLYVKNLGEFVTEDTLRERFSEFGKVCNVLIMTDAEGKSRGFGFVSFESHEEAKKAVEALNGALLGSEKLFVGKAQKKAEREELLKREYNEINNHHTENPKVSNLYVKNLDAAIDDRKLEGHFSAFGKVTSAKVMRHDDGISKGFGFVSFSTPQEAKKALVALHGTIFQGKCLYVATAQSKEERHRELQSYYSQSPQQAFYPYYSDMFTTPPFHQAYYGFPPIPSPNPVPRMNSQQTMGAMYPSMAQSYQRNDSSYIQARQPQQGTYMDFVYQQPMKYSNSILPTPKLDCWSLKSQQIPRDKRGSAGEASSKRSMATRGLNPAPSFRNCKPNNGKFLHPQGENLQHGQAAKKTGVLLEMNHSDAHKLLNSPKSLGMQIGRVVQVLKDANSPTLVDDRVSQPPKSALCLSY